jgi:hypothetical protein
MSQPESSAHTALRTPHSAFRTSLSDWRAFAAAGGATLAAASAADASIIYGTINSQVSIPVGPPTGHAVSSSKNFSIDGVEDNFRVLEVGLVQPQYNQADIGEGLNLFNGPASLGSSFRTAVDFQKGAAIAGTLNPGGDLRTVGATRAGKGQFPLNQTGFVGFQLPASKGGYVGWLRVEVIDRNHDGYPDALDAIDYAYSTSGPISAGDGVPSGVPEPSTKALALLAAGSAGVLAWRKRRTAARTGDPAALTSPDAARILSA